MINLKYLRTEDIKTGKNPEVVTYLDELYKSTSAHWLKYHKEWYINDNFVKGNHWEVYNKTLNKIQQVPLAPGEIRRTVNKIGSQIRGVKNFIKRNQPRWEVHPNKATDEAFAEATTKNKILQNIFRKRNLKTHMTGVIVNGLKYSAGFMEGGVVDVGGQKELHFWVNSTYDVLPDPTSKTIQGGRFLFKTASVAVESIKDNENYTVEDEKLADNKKAASEFQEILEKAKTNENSGSTKDLETAIVKELWLPIDKDGKRHFRVISFCGKNVLRVLDTKYRRFPIFQYSPEASSDSIFTTAWIKDMISLNKSLDKTTSQIESYVQRMLAGKWLIKKGVEVTSITDKGAEKIYYKGQTTPKQIDLSPLPSTPFVFIDKLEGYIEEIGGVRESSLGRASGSLQSGKGIEALQSADAGTVAEPVENLEIMLQEVAEFALEVIADYSIVSEKIIEDGEEINYIGAAADNKPKGAIVIDGSDEVRVSIVPEIAYSEEAKKDYALRLASAGLIDQETLLEQFKFSNIGDIVERMEKKKTEDYKEEMMKQRESHRTDGQGPQDSASLADQENMQMAAGQEVPATPKALWTPEHLALHMAFIQENKDAFEQQREMFTQHIQQEEGYEQSNQPQQRQ